MAAFGDPCLGFARPAMQFAAFHDLHLPALERDEARHNLPLGLLAAVRSGHAPEPRRWSLGGPGVCALQVAGRPIVLGDLGRRQCATLAEATRDEDYPAVQGPDLTARWFVARAMELGLGFGDPAPQQILALRAAPRDPRAPGRSRPVTTADAPLLADWMTDFNREAVPQDPPPEGPGLARKAGQGDYLFWEVEGRPVSLAGIVRRSRRAAAIGPVYTPPAQRGRGYAGAATAAVVKRIHAEGRTTACLYCDPRNPAAKRCYVKLGFEPVCDSWFNSRRAY
ncbi:MAG: GNAT family N-acetyltransferase [Kiloniellales bacterium]|nr:GNAT family N-acetyltransferase [Kiloniellales bacterium]